ncbi:MAG: DUF4112 domain-containing protein [Nannocystaceae bacterium]|nr:DUF4112 domain-containing protein [Nannocystaceae bacterium]
MTSSLAQPLTAADEWLSPRSDSVAEAEAMADIHLARQEEVERLGKLVRVLEDLVRVPGTKFGIGLDSIVGALLPGVGDAITGALGLTLITAAVRRGVPRVVVVRMVANLAIDLVVGLIPVLGDAFDLLWRSNTRNLALLERHQGELVPQAKAADYALVGLAGAVLAATVAAPFVLLYMLLGAVF